FDDGVAAVLGFGLLKDERAVGEDRVVAVLVEQFALAGVLGGVEAFDSTRDQAGGDGLLGALERGVAGLGDLRVRDPALLVFVPDVLRVLYVDPGVLG